MKRSLKNDLRGSLGPLRCDFFAVAKVRSHFSKRGIKISSALPVQKTGRLNAHVTKNLLFLTKLNPDIYIRTAFEGVGR